MKKRGLFAGALSFLLSIVGCSNSGIINAYRYENSEEYLSGNFNYSGNEVKKVFIDWIKGRVDIEQIDGDTLNVSESGTDLLEEEKLHYLIKDEVLYIRFCKSGYTFEEDEKKKFLNVQIPNNIILNASTISGGIYSESISSSDLNTSTLSGNIVIDKVKAPSFNASASSGKIDISSIESQEVVLSSMSGKIENDNVSSKTIKVSSSSGTINFDLVKCDEFTSSSLSGNTVINDIEAKEVKVVNSSGEVTVGIRDLEKLDVSTMSGAVNVLLKGECGIKAIYSSLSGKVKANGFVIEDDKYTYGNKKCIANINTSSGDLCLNKE